MYVCLYTRAHEAIFHLGDDFAGPSRPIVATMRAEEVCIASI